MFLIAAVQTEDDLKQRILTGCAIRLQRFLPWLVARVLRVK